MTRVVDLARLAGAYGHRAENGATGRAAAAAAAAGLGPGTFAVDVGGGEGAHAAVFAARGARAVVVDRSPEMARHSRTGGVDAVIGDGNGLPLASGRADLVYFHLSIHHGPVERWMAEAGRVVRPGGLVWVWTLAPEHLADSWLSRWFPTVAVLDRARFPAPALIAAAMISAGLEAPTMAGEIEWVERSAGSWAEAVRAGFVSTLHLVGEEELRAGLRAFEREHPDPGETIRYPLGFRRVSATRPSLRS